MSKTYSFHTSTSSPVICPLNLPSKQLLHTPMASCHHKGRRRASTRWPQPSHLLRESFLHQVFLSSGSLLHSHRSEVSRGIPSKSISTEDTSQEGTKCRASGGFPHTINSEGTNFVRPLISAALPSSLHTCPTCTQTPR